MIKTQANNEITISNLDDLTYSTYTFVKPNGEYVDFFALVKRVLLSIESKHDTNDDKYAQSIDFFRVLAGIFSSSDNLIEANQNDAETAYFFFVLGGVVRNEEIEIKCTVEKINEHFIETNLKNTETEKMWLLAKEQGATFHDFVELLKMPLSLEDNTNPFAKLNTNVGKYDVN
ncbi:MAG: hypothetical protein ACTSU7_13100 [Candidatus Heimdallarchaeaceae archaeon]